MEFLKKRASISISQNDESYEEILSSFQQLPKEIKSVTGFEIATFVLQCVDLIIAFVSIPALVEAMNNGHISVTIDGYKFNDSVSRIIEGIQSDPDLLEMAKQAYIEKTLSVEGNTKSSLQFRKKLQALIEAQMESQG